MLMTKRPVLEEPNESHIERCIEILGDIPNNLYNPRGPATVENSKQALTEWLKDRADYGISYWTLKLKANPNIIIGFGGVTIAEYENEKWFNLFYRLDFNYTGKGYTTEMSKFAILYAKEYYPAIPIKAKTRPDNLPSIKIMKKIGMVYARHFTDDYGISVEYIIP